MSRHLLKVALHSMTPTELKRVAIDLYRELNRRKLSMFAKPHCTAAGHPLYRDPENQLRTWTGRGRAPEWFKEALDKGFTAEQMMIEEDKP